MDQRLKLSAYLKTFSPNTYFQEPGNVKMKYPAILYKPDSEDRKLANNETYGIVDKWLVTIIDADPDSPVREAFRQSPKCFFERTFRSDGLNHFIYTLSY